MRATNAIMTSTDNELYSSCWPYASRVWNHFGVNPVLIHITKDISKPFPYPSPHGNIYIVEALPDLSEPFQGIVARFLAAAVIPGYNLIYDIDMYPCNKKLLDMLEPYDPAALITRTQLETILNNKRFEGGRTSASHETYKRILNENHIYPQMGTFWNQDRLKEVDATQNTLFPTANYFHQYGSDEYLFSQWLINMKSPPVIIVTPAPRHTMIIKSFLFDRDPNWIESRHGGGGESINTWSFDGLRRGAYWEAHIRFDKEKKLTQKICDTILEQQTD